MLIETCAKVNLTLEVLRRRDDGFHELATVFQAIDLHDRIRIADAAALEVEVVGADVPADERNLCHRAAVALAQRFGVEPRVRLAIEKRIPVGAGLGGGSGNAAGTLGALARWWQLPATNADLVELAASIGSDCAFFLRGGAAVGEGRGERLEPLPPPAGLVLVVLAPAEPVPTGAVYRALEGFRDDAGAATRRLSEGLRAGGLPPAAAWLVNDLEEPAARVSAAVAADRRRLDELAPGRFRLSGSGGSWFAPAEAGEAGELAERLRRAWPGRAVWAARPVDYGWRVVDEEA